MAKARTLEETTGFDGFSPALFDFFDGLSANQTRDWFLDHKAVYEREVRRPLGALVEALSFAFAAHDIPLKGDAKGSLFRINRDIRFSKDKTPYKTNASAVLSRDGTKTAKGLFYLQVGGPERDGFVAQGFHGLEPPDLAAIRRAIVNAPERWAETEAALGDAGLVLGQGDALTRLPKGFEDQADAPFAPALKLRNFIVSRRLPPERLYAPDLIDDLVGFAAAGLPLLSFGWRALQP